MNERQAHVLILLRFAPHILIADLVLFSLLLPWVPVNSSALLRAAIAGIWGFITIALQIRTGWWLAMFGLIGWVGFLHLSVSRLQQGSASLFVQTFCMTAFALSVWMLLLLVSRRAFRRYLANAAKPEP